MVNPITLAELEGRWQAQLILQACANLVRYELCYQVDMPDTRLAVALWMEDAAEYLSGTQFIARNAVITLF